MSLVEPFDLNLFIAEPLKEFNSELETFPLIKLNLELQNFQEPIQTEAQISEVSYENLFDDTALIPEVPFIEKETTPNEVDVSFEDSLMEEIFGEKSGESSQEISNYTYSSTNYLLKDLDDLFGSMDDLDFGKLLAEHNSTLPRSVPQETDSSQEVSISQSSNLNKKRKVELNATFSCKRKRSNCEEGSKNKPQDRIFDYAGISVPFKVLGIVPDNVFKTTAENEKVMANNSHLASCIDHSKQHICSLGRQSHARTSLEPIENLHENVKYLKNPLFGIKYPYEPEFFRVEIDPSNGHPFNSRRAGLCPYCPNLVFHNLKNSNYSMHLAVYHGVYPDNYTTPNPYNFGNYYVKKNNKHRKTIPQARNRKCVICPCCHELIEAACTQKTVDKPLVNYLRHFRDHHRITRGKGPLDFVIDIEN